jgi:hypothetical protein
MFKCILSIIAAGIFSVSVSAQSVKTLFECSPKLNHPYGFCAHVTRKGSRYDFDSITKQMELMENLGVTEIRSDIDYNTLSKNGNGILDQVLLDANRFHINLLGIVYDNRFSSKKWTDNSVFSNYLQLIQQRYLSQFKYLEFCNEIDLCKDSLVVPEYLSDLTSTYSFLKAANPHLQILLSGLSNVKNSFFDKAMNKGAYQYFDLMNFHFYGSPEHELESRIEIIKANMLKYHWNKPVWLTECGFHTAKDTLDNTNKKFFTVVVPAALQKTGYRMKGLSYGVISDARNQYTTLGDDEVQAYITDLGAHPVYITLDQVGTLDPHTVPVLVVTRDEGFQIDYFNGILNYVKRGGTIILPYGAPFYYGTSNGKTITYGQRFVNQLHIGELYWWADVAKKLKAPETPDRKYGNPKFGVQYSWSFNQKFGNTVRYLTNKNLRGSDQMIPITYAGNAAYTGVVAALYKLNSDLKGNIIVQTRLRTQSYFNREAEQARRIARMHLIAFAYGVDKVFWYKFRSCEQNLYYSEDNFGIVHKDLSPKPAYYAYKALTTFCPDGSTRPTLEVHGDIYISNWERPDGKKVWAIWNANGICYQNLTITGKPKCYDYLGNVIGKISENNFKVGSGVTYIVGVENVNIKQN